MHQHLLRWLIYLALLMLADCGGGRESTRQPTPIASGSTPNISAPASQSTPSGASTMPTAMVATAQGSDEPTVSATTAVRAEVTPTLQLGMFANPVIDKDFPDPDVLKVGDMYYVYATNDQDTNVQVARSQDLVHWELLADALPMLPGWAEKGNTWAPEVTPAGSRYVMYFTARSKGTSRQCIGLAVSDTPQGPFQSSAAEPFICQPERGGSIDPGSFVDDDGSRYLLWKNDGNCCGGQTWIFIQPASDDGLTLEGQPVELFRADKVWEGAVIEAPTLWKHAGRYYLFYSGNDYRTPRYAVGYAVADSALGPYTKPQKPLMATNVRRGVIGPGGQDIVVDKDGETWIVYHAWEPGGYRSLNLNELVWESSAPVVRGPERAPQALP